jgi:acetolactate decarboxylase
MMSAMHLAVILVPIAVAAGASDEPINTQCPIGKEPITRSAGTVEHDGHAIGLCCPGCRKAFLALDETRRDAFVAAALANRSPAPEPKPAVEPEPEPEPAVASPTPPATESAPTPYPLDTCIVSEAPLGSMGEPAVMVHDGQEVRFCCAGCIGGFERDPDGYLERVRPAGVRHHGAMREVMRDGRTEGRIAVAAATRFPHAYAVGALEGLRGEITIVDGAAWVTRLHDGAPALTGPQPTEGDLATLLTVAHVPAWHDVEVTGSASGLALEHVIANAAREAGHDPERPIPFMLEGAPEELALHVINGFCPVSTPAPAEAEPWRWTMADRQAVTVIGFYAPDSAGVMTHHGTALHAHAVVPRDGRTIAGHVDRLRIGAGMTLRVPASTWRQTE